MHVDICVYAFTLVNLYCIFLCLFYSIYCLWITHCLDNNFISSFYFSILSCLPTQFKSFIFSVTIFIVKKTCNDAIIAAATGPEMLLKN